MNYDFAKPNGFVSTKTLVGLADAGILSFAWWALHEDSSVDGEIQPLFTRKLSKASSSWNLPNLENRECPKTLKSTVS